jgi:rod shape-determining protein MreD
MRKAALVAFVLSLVLGQCLFSARMEIRGVVPLLPVIFVVFWALWASRTGAFYFAWSLGVVWDLLSPGPLGFYAAALGGLSVGIGSLGQWLDRDSAAVRLMLVFLASLVVGTLRLAFLLTENASWGLGEWIHLAVFPSLYTGILGALAHAAAVRMPFFQKIRPRAELGLHA